MDVAAFTKPSGDIVQATAPTDGHPYDAFVPHDLPPSSQSLAIQQSASLLADAADALGLLRGIGMLLRNPDLLVYPYMRQEAVASSRIEGTRTSFIELLAFEVEGAPPGSDVVDVRNYLVALDQGLARVGTDGVTATLVRDLHRTLMRGARGEGLALPGEFRFRQNQVGGDSSSDPRRARYVPPPPEPMQDCLDALFEHIAEPSPETPALVDIAWVHYQFEAIHPFNDGNGRVGRLLIPLLLSYRKRMDQPLLYLSPYFDRHRSTYYDKLFDVSAKGDWAGWLQFFLVGVIEQATRAADTAKQVVDLGEDWKVRVRSLTSSPTAQVLAENVLQHVVLNAETAQSLLDRAEASASLPTVYRAIQILESAGIIEEYTGRVRGRLWYAPELRRLLDTT